MDAAGTSRRTLVVALALTLTGVLAACGGPPATETTSPPPAVETSGTPADPDGDPGTTPSATPSPSQGTVAMPSDCRAILSSAVLAQLDGTPLNHEAFGESGVLSNGSLRCIWADPAADTTGLTTDITRMNRGPALDLLNTLADDEGFLCYSPDEGTRCEKTWPNEHYPVTDGRTLYWRDGILIDTRYSNLAPSGYTASIVESIFATP